MKIDGKEIAASILEKLSKRVAKLKQKGITPKLAVILIGEDPSSLSYIKQKEIKAAKIGAELVLYKFPHSTTQAEITDKVRKLNENNEINGLIIQRPLPDGYDGSFFAQLVNREKDVDGFNPESPFDAPVAEAVLTVLEEIHKKEDHPDFSTWLDGQTIAIIGKGHTAGMPIINMFRKRNIEPDIIDSKTQNRNEILLNADVIISSVGKQNTLKKEEIKQGAIVIGVGLHDENDKFRGDFNEEDISSKVSYYTPTPGGIGPINVACLMNNLVEATEF